MVVELKATIINMKQLSQEIDDPIIINGADAGGRSLRVIFTQEAAAQFSPYTKVYLAWHHQQLNIKGYNVFTEMTPKDEDSPPAWELFWPQSMLHEGDVMACIELVDDISIAASTNFFIHILRDPNDGYDYIISNDYSDFQNAVIAMTTLSDQISDKMQEIEIDFNDIKDAFAVMQEEHEGMKETVAEAAQLNQETVEALEQITQQSEQIEQTVSDFGERLGVVEEAVAHDWSIEINQAEQAANAYTDNALTWIRISSS